MSPRDTIHQHARQIADREIQRCRPLRALPSEEAALVERAAHRAAAALADFLLEQARTEPRLHAALETIYGTDGGGALGTTSGLSTAETVA